MKHIVFDLGQVLIQWDPEAAFSNHFADHDDRSQAIRDWFGRVGFDEWNRAQDGGRSFAEGYAEAQKRHGALAEPLAGYLDRFGLTIAQPVPGTWHIATSLKQAGHRLFAITNWGAETWPAARQLYPDLATLFEDVVVSGTEGLLKPDPAIYQLLCQRNDLRPEDCIFIDDSAANVRGARDVGMDAIHFTDAADLRTELSRRGIG